MNNVTVSKDELLKVLTENKAKHVQIFNDALEGVRVEYKKLLQREMDKLDSGKEVKSSVSVTMPRSHEEEYDEVIQMLTMSVDDEIELTRHEFQQYVQDKWVTQSEKDLLRHFALSSSNSSMYQ
jgi:hypothetical protein